VCERKPVQTKLNLNKKQHKGSRERTKEEEKKRPQKKPQIGHYTMPVSKKRRSQRAIKPHQKRKGGVAEQAKTLTRLDQ